MYEFDCDGCGRYIRTASDGTDLVLVLCPDCNAEPIPADATFVEPARTRYPFPSLAEKE